VQPIQIFNVVEDVPLQLWVIGAKWKNVLGGADVFTFDQCWTAQEEIRIDL